MAKLSAKFGPIHGNDGNTAYRTINGTTFQNYIDTAAPKKERTPRQKTYGALLKVMNRYTYIHYPDLCAFFPKGNKRSSRHAFLAHNRESLAAALYSLAERSANGEKITDQQIEDAVSTYAQANPRSIVVGLKKGYLPIYLEGEWPSKFRFLLYDQAVTPVEFQTADGTFVQEEGDADANGGTTGNGGDANSGQGGTSQSQTGGTSNPGGGSSGGYDGD